MDVRRDVSRHDIYLFSTTNLASGRHDALHRMVRSVAQVRDVQPERPIRLFLLLQNAAAHPAPVLPDWVAVQTTPGLVPLSTARNILLAAIDLPRASDTAAVVAFPDDDAWYVDGTLPFMADLIARSTTVDFAVCRSGEDACPPARDARPMRLYSAPMRLQQAISFGNSNTIFLRASLAARLGGFDETLGLGTPAVAGEDTDYSIRAWHDARETRFVDACLVGHRDNDPALKKRYFKGALLALRKNKARSLAARIALARKYAVRLTHLLR